jgi:hypothetical protein
MSGRPSHCADLTIDDIRQYFLRPAILEAGKNWQSLATTFISFCLEWDYRNALLDLRVGGGTVEPFVVHLLKGCALFESLLRAKPTKGPPVSGKHLGDLLHHFYLELGIPHDIRTREESFQSVLDDLAGADDCVSTVISFTGRMRNSLGHNLGWNTSLTKYQYHRLFRMVAKSCLHVIGCLYR